MPIIRNTLALILLGLTLTEPALAQTQTLAQTPAQMQTQTPAPVDHPLIGKWQWTRPGNQCSEVFDFRPDGSAPVVSGEEKTENIYTVSSSADRNGFYQLNMKTLKDYGGKDCGDDSSDTTNQETTHFILFEPQKTMHIVCAEPRVSRCYGPLKRIP